MLSNRAQGLLIKQRVWPVLLIGVLSIPPHLSAQSRQRVAIQAAVLLVRLSGTTFSDLGFGTGIGGEVQLRINPSAFSLGVGLQLTKHSANFSGGGDNLTLTGVFAEPRYAIPVGGRSLRPYVAARIGYLHQSIGVGTGQSGSAGANGTGFGAGGGFVIRMTSNLNLDLGLALTTANFGHYEFDDGTSGEKAGKGSSFVLKAGFNLGLGR